GEGVASEIDHKGANLSAYASMLYFRGRASAAGARATARVAPTRQMRLPGLIHDRDTIIV
ncbi:MAG TPA: hypothetical protein VIY29_22630, partial [Ktedonobacteraceae bacterium]